MVTMVTGHNGGKLENLTSTDQNSELTALTEILKFST